MDDAQRKDLDETRRLLYMALAASRTDRYDLAGTLTNALAHHGQGTDPAEAMDQVITAIEHGDDAWIRERIADVTAALDAAGSPEPVTG